MPSRHVRRHRLSNTQSFLAQCQNTIRNVLRLLQSDGVSSSVIDSCETRIALVMSNFARTYQALPDDIFAQTLDALVELRQYIANINRNDEEPEFNLVVQRVYSGAGGPPRYNITRNQLLLLLQYKFTVPQIATLLHVSQSTIHRRMAVFGLSVRGLYATLGDDELDQLVTIIIENNRHVWARMIQYQLEAQGHFLQRARARLSLQRLDPLGLALRWSDTVQRRAYRAAGPNSLWHIDGNHRLIRWKFVIHGGIDGFSRMITYLGVETNNRATTVLSHFEGAVQRFGLPSRVRADRGGENLLVGNFMNQQRGENRGSIIYGRSLHNQRIERLWVDLFDSCTNHYYNLFNFLERGNILNIENDTHMFCLHNVYKPKIQASLNLFLEQWNRHGLRTEHSRSPYQLYISGMLNGASHLIAEEISNTQDINDYGIDWDAPQADGYETEMQIQVPNILNPLPENLIEEFNERVARAENEEYSYGINSLLSALSFMQDHNL